MFRTDKKNVRIIKLSTIEAIQHEDGIMVKARITLEADLAESELSKLPQIAKAVKALVKASISRTDDDGPDSVNVTMRFKFDTMRYHISDLPTGEGVSFDGSICNRPRVAVVKGAVALRWVVEATMDLDEHSGVASVVQSEDGVTMTTRAIQLNLPLSKAA